jgi:ferric iron reductase protein FhuF
MYPGMQVTIDLTGKIDEDADRVKITRVIVDSTSIEGQTIWNNNLSTNYYDYVSLKALLSYNSVPYYEDT